MRLLCLLILWSYNLYSQNITHYYDENGKKITFKDYNDKLASFKYVNYSIYNDTAAFQKLYLVRNEGKLDTEKLDLLKKYLVNSSKKELNPDNVIVIIYTAPLNYFDNDNPYIFDISKNKKIKDLHKLEDINLYWFMHSNNIRHIKKYNGKIEWIEDKYNTFPKLFMEYVCHIGSHIIIKPNGEYLVRYCMETGADSLLQDIEEYKKG